MYRYFLLKTISSNRRGTGIADAIHIDLEDRDDAAAAREAVKLCDNKDSAILIAAVGRMIGCVYKIVTYTRRREKTTCFFAKSKKDAKRQLTSRRIPTNTLVYGPAEIIAEKPKDFHPVTE